MRERSKSRSWPLAAKIRLKIIAGIALKLAFIILMLAVGGRFATQIVAPRSEALRRG